MNVAVNVHLVACTALSSDIEIDTFANTTGRAAGLTQGSERMAAWYGYCLTKHQTLANGTRNAAVRWPDGVQGVKELQSSVPSGEFAVVVSEGRQDVVSDEKTVLEHPRSRLLPDVYRSPFPILGHGF